MNQQLSEGRGWGLGTKGEEIKQYKLVLTKYRDIGEYSQQYSDSCVWSRVGAWSIGGPLCEVDWLSSHAAADLNNAECKLQLKNQNRK